VTRLKTQRSCSPTIHVMTRLSYTALGSGWCCIGDDGHVLVALVNPKAHVLRSVHIAKTIHFIELARNIDQILVDDWFRRLGALPGQLLVEIISARLARPASKSLAELTVVRKRIINIAISRPTKCVIAMWLLPV
jgi:hypothetical protein